MIFIIKGMLFILGLFFSFMAIGGLLVSYENYKAREKYIFKLLFTIFPLIFGIIFIYMGITYEL